MKKLKEGINEETMMDSMCRLANTEPNGHHSYRENIARAIKAIRADNRMYAKWDSIGELVAIAEASESMGKYLERAEARLAAAEKEKDILKGHIDEQAIDYEREKMGLKDERDHLHTTLAAAEKELKEKPSKELLEKWEAVRINKQAEAEKLASEMEELWKAEMSHANGWKLKADEAEKERDELHNGIVAALANRAQFDAEDPETLPHYVGKILDERDRLKKLLTGLEDAVSPIAATKDRTMTEREQQRIREAIDEIIKQ